MSGQSGKRKGQRAAPRPPQPGSLYERYKDALRRGHVAALRGRNDAAVDAYGEAAEIAPDRALPHVSVGGILVKMDRLSDALAAYERAIALAPRDEGALRGLADVHARNGQRSEAAEALDRLADTLDAGGRLADATDAARRSLELAESRSRRQHVEDLADRLRASNPGDEAAQRALDQALRILAPASTAVDDAERRGEPGDRGAEPADEALAAAAPRADSSGAVNTAGDAPEREDGSAEPEEIGAAASAPGDDQGEPTAEPAGLGIALGALAETALFAGDPAAREHLLAAARAHRRAGRTSAALDACDLAIAVGPSDVDVHLLLAELYLDRGWRLLAVDKLLLLGRLAELDDDPAARERVRGLVSERLADEPRVAQLVA
ncbi:MAG TPA: tetratricopeptide repeat protein [Candidatus Limnocylindrales bacterium]|nr:tetratricopeptide repeat protein [Candidatus Limnocylindrales bacterium]